MHKKLSGPKMESQLRNTFGQSLISTLYDHYEILPFLDGLGSVAGPVLGVVDDVADLHVEAPVLRVQVVHGGLRYLPTVTI